MNVYNAIMRAADHIERHPQEFNFYTTSIPDSPGCGTPGCALGWIAVFSDREASHYKSLHYPKDFRCIGAIAENVLNCGVSLEFYFRMDAGAHTGSALRMTAKVFSLPSQHQAKHLERLLKRYREVTGCSRLELANMLVAEAKKHGLKCEFTAAGIRIIEPRAPR